MPINVNGQPLSFVTGLDDGGLMAGVEKVKAQLNSVAGVAQKNANSIEGLMKKTTAAISAYASLSTATNLIKDIVAVRGQFQQLETAYRTFLGSKEKGDKLLAESVALAAKTPFTLLEVGQGAKQLLAYGFAAENVTENLRMLGNVAAGTGAPLNDLVYLYGTLRTQGTAMTKDIREFTGRGIDIVGELAKQFNVAWAEVAGMVEAGKVGFPQVEQAFRSMTSSGGMFFNLMEEQSKTLTGLVSNLGDAWDRMLNDIGKSNEGVFATAIKGATSLIDNYQSVLDILKVLVLTYGSYRAALLLTNATMFISDGVANGLTKSMALHNAAMIGATRVTSLWKAAMLALPTAAMGAAIAGLAAIVYSLVTSTNAAEIAQEALNDIQVDAAKAANDEKENLDALQRVLKSDTATRQEKLAAVKSLRDITKETLKQLSDEQVLLGKGIPLLNQYIDGLRKRSEAEAALAKIKYLSSKADELDIKGTDAMSGFEEFSEEIRSLFGFGDYKKVGYFNQLFFGDKQDQAIVGKKKKEYLDAAEEIRVKYESEIGKLLSNSMDSTSNQRQLKVIENEIQDQKILQAQVKKTSAEYAKYGEVIKKLQAEADAAKPKTYRQLADATQVLNDLRSLEKKAFEEYNTSTDQAQKKRLSNDLEYIRKRIKTLDVNGQLKAAGKAQLKADTDLQEKQKQLNDDLLQAEADARRSGLIQEESEIDRIRQRYDELRKQAKEAGASAEQIQRINNAEALQIGNERQKNEVAQYKETLDTQKALFEQYEEAKKEIGADRAREMYAEQTKGYESYLDYLKVEAAKLIPSMLMGTAGIKEQEQLIAINKKIVATENDQAEKQREQKQEDLARLLKDTASYHQQVELAEAQFQRDLALLREKFTGEDLEAREAKLTQSLDDQLINIKNNLAQQSTLYKTLNADITTYTKDELKKRMDLLKKWMKDGFIEEGGKRINLTPKNIADLEQWSKQGDEIGEKFEYIWELLREIGQLGDVFSSLGNTIGSGFLQEAGAAISAIAKQLDNLEVALSSKTSDEQKQMAAAQSAVTLVTMIASSAQRRREETEKYYASVIGLQQSYNLALNDQIRLQHELEQNVFITDYQEQMLDGIKASYDAIRNFEEALDKLQQGKAKVGQRNAVDWGQVGTGAASGAAIGALVGPIGAAVGAVIGGAIGFFLGKKKKDVFTNLLGEYPDLVIKAADGTESLNTALAQTLIDTDMVDEKTKQILGNVIEWGEKLEEARAQIKAVVSDLAGSLGNDLRDSLVDAFKNGTSAAEAFGESVNKTLENIISNMLFNRIFEQSFDDLQKRMEKSFDLGGDQNFVDDVTAFYQQMPDLAKQFELALAAANEESQRLGLSVFARSPNAQGGTPNSMAGAIKGMSDQQADLLAGQFGGLRITAVQQLAISSRGLVQLQEINYNTATIREMVTTIKRWELNGFKVKVD